MRFLAKFIFFIGIAAPCLIAEWYVRKSQAGQVNLIAIPSEEKDRVFLRSLLPGGAPGKIYFFYSLEKKLENLSDLTQAVFLKAVEGKRKVVLEFIPKKSGRYYFYAAFQKHYGRESHLYTTATTSQPVDLKLNRPTAKEGRSGKFTSWMEELTKTPEKINELKKKNLPEEIKDFKTPKKKDSEEIVGSEPLTNTTPTLSPMDKQSHLDQTLESSTPNTPDLPTFDKKAIGDFVGSVRQATIALRENYSNKKQYTEDDVMHFLLDYSKTTGRLDHQYKQLVSRSKNWTLLRQVNREYYRLMDAYQEVYKKIAKGLKEELN